MDIVVSEAEWYRGLGTEWDSIASPDPSYTNYMYNSGYLPYICANGMVKAFGLTDTWLYVHVNGYWSSGITLPHEINNKLGEKLFTLPPQRGNLGGYPVFEPIPKGEWDNPWLIFYSMLIHHPGKLPYQPVTKRELFEISKKMIDTMEKEYQAGNDFQRKNMGEEWFKPLAQQNALELDMVMHEQFDFRELGKMLTD